VGEETRIGASLRRRRGVTGRVGIGFSGSWVQGQLRHDGLSRGIEVLGAGVSLGLAATRGTSLTLRATGEWANEADRDLVSVSLALDHETLDRIDFPRAGANLRGQLEVEPDRFASAVLDARYYVPLHGRVTADVGAWLGYQTGDDVPLRRRFALGGAHPSAVFGQSHGIFQGLPRQEHLGSVAQVARVGLRWQVTGNGYLRAGVDVGAVREEWQFPLDRPMTGWALTAGVDTIIGPVQLQLAKLWGDRHDPRLSVGVGRQF
jgi:outer membrane protein assembly factor BamA